MAFMNTGVGGQMKKRSAPPPPVSGKGPGLAVVIAAGRPKGPAGAPGDRAEPGRGPAPRPERARPSPPPAPAEQDAIAPEAVCYRSEMETCGNCEYNAGGQCSKLHIDVQDGDGCNLFKDRESGEDADRTAESFENEDDENAEAMQ